MAAGGHNGSIGSISLQLEWVKAGANIIMHCSDIFLFADKYLADINRIRSFNDEEEIGRLKDESA
jgi:hypothetical protein